MFRVEKVVRELGEQQAWWGCLVLDCFFHSLPLFAHEESRLSKSHGVYHFRQSQREPRSDVQALIESNLFWQPSTEVHCVEMN